MHKVTALVLAAWFLTGCSSPSAAPAPPAASTTLAAREAPHAVAASPTPPAPSASAAAVAVTATATAAATAPPKAHARNLTVDRLVVARGVESREPLGADTTFGADEKRLFAFVEVNNPERAAGQVRVQFVSPRGDAEPPIELAVGESSRWRTWAFTRRAHEPGTWHAIVRDERDHVLASTEFDVRG